ncbi:MAG: hypothetical protein GXP38_10335, partial [Chloroflexi bacterium]|nr:hypothetical protein [Chloroflexota bacterium]
MRLFHPLRRLLLALSLTALFLSLPTLILALVPAAEATWSDMTPAVGQWINTTPSTVSITVQDADGLSADASYQYLISGAADWSDWQTSNIESSSSISTTRRLTVTGLPFADGLNFIQFRIVDSGGTSHSSPAYPVSLDTVAPAAPSDLQAQPASWSASNSFTLKWSNPADASGISGAWYKLDTAPKRNDDGVWVEGDALEQISNIGVSGDGAHTVWLWLGDKAGNSNYHNAATQTLYLDTTAPPALQNVAVTPAGWTNQNRFDLSWDAPNDASGISGVRALLDRRPTQANDGTLWENAENGYQGYTL